MLIAVLSGISSLGLPRGMAAQGISTATIRGAVRTEDAANVDGASVHVFNTASGFTLDTRVNRGRFLVHGLEVGGPYVIEVRHIGFVPQRSRPVSLTLGEALELEFVLQRVATQLERVQVNAPARGASLLGGGGTATIIRDSLVQQLPTLNRNFIDFVQLAPQVSTKIGFQRIGMSAAGANLRFNNYLINGAEEHYVNSNVSPAHNAGKSIPIDAVKEYQVLVAPYDVRYGNFAGALVNTVTQSGTNEFRGSTYAYWRNNRLARGALDSLRYERFQYGFSLGGPIVRDRIHFFIAPEIQSLTSPAPGPYLGQPSSATSPVPVRETDVERFRTLMRAHGLTPGSGGFVEVENPLRNIFVRLDMTIPAWNSRVVAFLSDARAEDSQFSRVDTFYLSSSRQTGAGQLRLASTQLHSELPRIAGGHNELLISHLSDRSEQLPDVRQPLVRVLVPATAGGFVPLNAGATELAHGVFRRSRATTVKDELTLPWGADHVLVLGLQAERFRIRPGGVTGGYGVWTFSSLDDFERGVAERFELRRDFGSANALLRGGQYDVYAGDEWRAGERVSISLGMRADMLDLGGHAPHNAVVDSIFGRRTDEMPQERVHFSPRVGFTWDLFGTGRQKLRGGIGVFTGRPPLAWLRSALSSYGIGIGTLRCGSLPTDNGPPPPFQPDYLNPPTACATGSGLTSAPRGDVDLLDRNLRMARSLRTSLAYERQLPWGLQGTTEFLFTRYLSDFLFVNLNLQGPQAVDRFGRVLYGTMGPSGLLVKRRTDRFSEVIDLRNTSRNYSQQLSTRVERRFAQGIAASAAYTYSGMRDVQSPSRINTRGSVIWADARAVSGRHEDEKLGISLNDLPHRAVIAATWSSTRRHWPTAFSLFYVGESGSPFTYRAGGIGSLGDLNADGSNANDPIYVPLSALDTTEIRFTGRSDSVGADNSLAVQAQRQGKQQNALDAFIRQTPCLRRQRGRIMQRNSCREPWSHNTVASFRQAVPVAGRALEFELDVFNVLNLLNPRWGHYRIAVPQLLEHVGQTASGDPIFRFHTARPQWTTLRTESAFQLQLALRYRF